MKGRVAYQQSAAKDEIPQWKNTNEIIRHAFKGMLRSYLLTVGVKGSISLFLLLPKLLKGKASFKSLIVTPFFGDSTQRTAKMLASFTLIWKFIVNILNFKTGESRKLHGAVAGAIGGAVSILFESSENRLGFAQNVFFRALQAGKNSLKEKNIWTVPHGDSWLFAMATASITYAYGFRPDTIPKPYYNWIVAHAGVPKPCLKGYMHHSRAVEKNRDLKSLVDLNEWCGIKGIFEKTKMLPENQTFFKDYVASNNGKAVSLPCSIYHPLSTSCLRHNGILWGSVFKAMFPVYFSLTAIPLAFLNTKKLLASPGIQFKKAVLSAIRSAVFIAGLICTFKAGMCSTFNFIPGTHNKALVYPLAFLSSLWIFFEAKQKRVELAMFVLPKAVQSLYIILIDRGWMFDIPGIEIAASSFGMAVLMGLYQKEPYQISSLLYKIMRATIGTF